MARPPRTLVIALILVAGVAFPLPTQIAGTTPFGVVAPGSVEPGFRITAWRGSLTIAGHTRSARHEARLRELATQHYPDHERIFAFRPLGLVPDWWVDVTTELVAALAPAISPDARLTGDALQIGAIVRSDSATGPGTGSLEPLLPSAVKLEERIVPAGPGLSERALCQRLFREFRAGPVNFAGVGTTLRPSAHPELDRIAMLADACRGATLTITGHTDATGSEDWNRQLSLARARAVADHLIKRGVAADAIVAAGAGSAVPVADNENRYGRSLNRRIEVSFSYDPPSSGDVSLTSSISNSNVALGGTGGLPRSP